MAKASRCLSASRGTRHRPDRPLTQSGHSPNRPSTLSGQPHRPIDLKWPFNSTSGNEPVHLLLSVNMASPAIILLPVR
jgi:hypothetical protein